MSSALPHERPFVAAWTIDACVAKQPVDAACPTGGTKSVQIRLDHPSSGIGVGVGTAPAPALLLGLVLDPAAERATGGHVDAVSPADRWVRGDDVVAVYEPQDPRSLRATAMWRRWPTESPAIAAWELVVSCQTSLLQSDATVVVRTVVPAGRIEPLPNGAVIARTAAGPSILVAVHPLDARRPTIVPAPDGDSTAIECGLFSSVVEKGVLLRGRVLAAIGPRENDAAWSARLLDAFGRSPPPLTT